MRKKSIDRLVFLRRRHQVQFDLPPFRLSTLSLLGAPPIPLIDVADRYVNLRRMRSNRSFRSPKQQETSCNPFDSA